MNQVLSLKTEEFQNKVNTAPKLPGCYIYKNSKGKVLYVGKAKILINRVKSYFINYKKLDIKIQNMLDQAYDIELITVDSEIEALILETNLIKKYRPKYNSLMIDDKNYSWVKFEKHIKGVRDFPRIKLVREKIEDGSEYFGPFPDRVPLRNVLKRLRKVFPYVTCNRRLIQKSDNPLKVDTNNSTPCLYYHLGLCNAPCASLESRSEYLKRFNEMKKFFRGEKLSILNSLEKEMLDYSKEKNYEDAAILRDKINDVKYVTKNIRIDSDVDDIVVSTLKAEERENGLNQLIEELKFPNDKLRYHKSFKIECYDISNIQGTNPVGAMTVMVNGVLSPKLYRKFKIKSKNTPNDFFMLQEMLSRRFSHVNSKDLDNADNTNSINKDEISDPSFSVLPDLIIIDGGKGQLSSSYKVLFNLGLHNTIPIIGLAKRDEEVFKLTHQFRDDFSGYNLEFEKIFTRIYLPRRSESLYLAQRIRDEAHRFGITFHRKLRSQSMIDSTISK